MNQRRSTAATGMQRVEKWEVFTAWPLFVGSLAFVGILTWSLFDEGEKPPIFSLAVAMLPLLWIWFGVDYFVRLAMAGVDRRRFVVTRVLDLASLVLPFLRPFLIIVYIWRLPVFNRGSARAQRTRLTLTTALFTFMLVYTASYGVWLVERHAPGASIVSFGDALWWGFTTISTVGYGDFVPVTVPGRLLAISLMIGGFFVIGVVTATLLSGLNERIRKMAHHSEGHRDLERPKPAAETVDSAPADPTSASG